MGSCNPKAQPLIPPKKQSLQLCSKKLKIHLQMKQAKINQQIIYGQNQLVKKINADKKYRDRFEQLLLAERIVNGLKYTAAYTLLIQYAQSIGTFANFICQNINDQKKLEPWNSKLYSMMYASQKMPLTTLQEYRKCMQYIDNEIMMDQHCSKEIKLYLTPQPTPQEMNIYMVEMSQRNKIALDKINQAGHDFSINYQHKTWERQFQEKSKSYRNSLLKNDIIGMKNDKDSKGFFGFGGENRKSVSNPFDKKHPVESKGEGKNAEDIKDDKVDQNDISPNITDLMKKINESKANFKRE